MYVPPIKSYLWQLQQTICAKLTAFETQKTFFADAWESALGTGISCVLEAGETFEKAGVNVSHIKNNHLPQAATQKRPELLGCQYEALGISLVIHPRNPYVPTTHANLRYFYAAPPQAEPIWWFGGGFDLTPYYGFTEDCIHWHKMAKAACDPFGKTLYTTCKKACDDYFYLPHRGEARGIGGLFFDDLQFENFETSFQFMQSVGEHFLQGYLPIVEKRYTHPYGEKERTFQSMRRGRYVEFNLLYDRGTLFGLQSRGRTESILISMPPTVSWVYDWHPEPGTPEARLYTDFLPAKHWLEENDENKKNKNR